ncbi:MAG TPA: aldo/keto reductase [Desulfobacteraceae bacterium]|nr:aldo/keto reductase [Desulfobacteraceae bacterium]
MEYRTVPKNFDKLSVLGFGCMRLPVDNTNAIDEPRAIAQIRHAIDNGVNYFDTAWPYHGGKSEPLLGKALRDGYREKVKIATKLPSWMVETREQMDEFLDAQRSFLETDTIDYYLVHNLNGPVWEKMKSLGVLEFLDKAKADGRIINTGFSFHGHIDDFKTMVDDYPWEICQIQYNYLDEVHQAGTEGLEYAAARNLGVIIMEPLRGGNLGVPEPPPDIADIWNNAPKHRTPVEWALRWIWNRPEVTTVLSGMNEEAHIEENLKVAGEALPNSLSNEELAVVTSAADTYKRLMKVGCTGCEYCKPCPEGVNISAAFEVLNKLHLFKNEQEARFLYAIRCGDIFSGGIMGYASQCIQCGECIDKCPQNIPIPDALEWVKEDLEDEHTPERLAQGKKMLNME